jgi:hypothetical protein
MKTAIKRALLFAALALPCGMASAATTWTDFNGTGPFQANTLDANISSAEIESPFPRVSASGNPGTCLELSACSIFLYASQDTVFTTLSFDATSNDGSISAPTVHLYGSTIGLLTAFPLQWSHTTFQLSSYGTVSAGDYLRVDVDALINIILLDNIRVTSTPAVVPEPSAFALAGLGAGALLAFRRRK